MSIQRRENSRGGRLHVRQQKRIAQQFEPRSQKGFHFLRARKAFTQQDARDTRRVTNFIPRDRRAIQLFCWRYDPSAFHGSIYFRRLA
jgi:hypothetical protein